MIDISGHLRTYHRDIGFRDDNQPIVINCCGYQQFKTRSFSRCRREGRLDYQLIYILEGCGTFLVDGQDRCLHAGELLLYRPGEPQIYSYDSGNRPLVYWIHFTGTAVEDWLQKFQIQTDFIGCSTRIQSIFQEIILELTLKKKNFEEITASLFYQLLAAIERVRDESRDQSGSLLDELIVELNRNYQRAWTLDDMAAFCKMSQGYFAHCFKESMQMSPMRYLTGIRISKAKDFLLNSNLTIASIGAAVGYENPLYFSRVFKHTEGLSPRDYRQRGE